MAKSSTEYGNGVRKGARAGDSKYGYEYEHGYPSMALHTRNHGLACTQFSVKNAFIHCAMVTLKPFTLALLCFIVTLVTLALGEVDSKPRGHTMGKRDDNLPARVPYVFPPPGTDPIADAISTRRTNGLLLDLDGVLLNAPTILIVTYLGN
ncbi:hypothetical protein K438DRAFT_1957457 [Mycena galopus ATCC 62051]|nr:hypothetical protein K438DRAFT_1957457 [Mycena galopus ATCC 62051]